MDSATGTGIVEVFRRKDFVVKRDNIWQLWDETLTQGDQGVHASAT